MEWYATIFATLGALWLSTLFFKVLYFTYIYVRPSSLSHYHHHHSNSSAPPWAIVTGASDGIGKAYCYALADANFNVVLHGRNSTKLHHIRHELQNQYPHLSFRIVIADANKDGPEAIKHIKEIADGLRDLHVTILINNVGTGSKLTGALLQEFLKDVPEDIDGLINTNARFPAQFTNAVLPLLISHGGPALIMTMGSMSDFGMPYLLTYSAAKSFDLAFSKGLKREMEAEGRNVEVLGIMTGPVTDVGWDRSKSSLLRPTSSTYARAALDRVGCGEDVVAGYWAHGVLWALLDLVPQKLFGGMLVWGVMKTQKSLAEAARKEKA